MIRKISSTRLTFFQGKKRNFKKCFFSEKIPYAIFSFCNYFHVKTLAFLAQNISKMPHTLEGHFPPLSLACKRLFPGTSRVKKKK